MGHLLRSRHQWGPARFEQYREARHLFQNSCHPERSEGPLPDNESRVEPFAGGWSPSPQRVHFGTVYVDGETKKGPPNQTTPNS